MFRFTSIVSVFAATVVGGVMALPAHGQVQSKKKAPPANPNPGQVAQPMPPAGNGPNVLQPMQQPMQQPFNPFVPNAGQQNPIPNPKPNTSSGAFRYLQKHQDNQIRNQAGVQEFLQNRALLNTIAGGSNPLQQNPFQQPNPFASNPFQQNPFQQNPFQQPNPFMNPYQQQNPFMNPYQQNVFQPNPFANPFQQNPFQQQNPFANPFQQNPFQQQNPFANPFQQNPFASPFQQNPFQPNVFQQNPFQQQNPFANPFQQNPFANPFQQQNPFANPFQQLPGGFAPFGGAQLPLAVFGRAG